jgi:DNA-binding Lrp family transcriptional regulator
VQYDVDEIDLQLLHLLQIAPRISWTSAAEILRVSANAPAARWSRLHDAGLAWISVYPNPVSSGHLTAIVDVDCIPRQCGQVAAQLIVDPRVVSVEECAGGRDLLLTVMVSDLPSLSAFVLDSLNTMEGVTGTRTRIVTAIHAEGSRWRLDALDPAQQRRALAARDVQGGHRTSLAITDHWPLIEALSRDGRSPVAALARTTGGNASTARRHLAQLLNSGMLSIRCDITPAITGWGVACSWLARTAPAERPQSVSQLCRLSQLRVCFSLTGPANLGFTVYSRTMSGLAAFEDTLGTHLPTLQCLETMIHLRTHKRMGWITTVDGRCTGEVIVPDVFRPTAHSAHDEVFGGASDRRHHRPKGTEDT